MLKKTAFPFYFFSILFVFCSANWATAFDPFSENIVIKKINQTTGKGKPKSDGAVFEEKGNIFIQVENKAIQLTTTGLDHEPVRSPDEKWVAFSKKIEGKVKHCSKVDQWICATDQLWIINLETKTERMLVEPLEDAADMREVIGSFEYKTFSPDSKTIFFLTPAWATSSAIHAVEINGDNERFITAGNSLKIIKSIHIQELVGHLIVHKHKYYPGGSYDFYWLISPKGEELRPLGEDTSYFTETYRVEYMEDGSPESGFCD